MPSERALILLGMRIRQERSHRPVNGCCWCAVGREDLESGFTTVRNLGTPALMRCCLRDPSRRARPRPEDTSSGRKLITQVLFAESKSRSRRVHHAAGIFSDKRPDAARRQCARMSFYDVDVIKVTVDDDLTGRNDAIGRRSSTTST